jgi:peptide/nickel transport system ATP-binding protein
MNNDLLLEIKNLVTEFKSDEETVIAVNNISFSLNKGEIVGIVGESGSGKSVTSLSVMKLISNSGRIVSGEILFHSKDKGIVDLLKLSDKEIRYFRGNEVAMIFQEPMTSLNPVFTCGNQVMEAILVHQKVSKEEAKKKTLALFEKVQLPNPELMFDTNPHQISGGQKQRVMIAMAMSCSPSVLVADEPTTALDVTVQATILNLMKDLQKEIGMSILFISHDLGVIAELADRVIVMYKGKVVEEGNVDDIFMNPKHPYTKGLLACRPPLDKRLRVLPTMNDFMTEDKDGMMQEIKKSVDDTVTQYVVTREETLQRHEELYKKKPILSVKNLKTYFPINKGIFGQRTGRKKAVDDVSFEVYPGETLGLVGESGCGKTTLGRTIIRLIEPISGEVIFDGKNLLELPPKELRQIRKHIQIIFQDPYSSLNPRMTIGNAILEPMQVHGLHKNDKNRKEKVMELLSKVSLPHNYYNRYPHEFSGGQRQRVCIARALALEPKFIICDESISALDVSIQAQVLNLLNQLRKDFGFTYIFISHDLSVVKFMSDRMIVMKDGKIVEQGDADEIYNNPKSDFTKTLIDSIPQGIKAKYKVE